MPLQKKNKDVWDGKPKRECAVCGRGYKYRLQTGGSGKERWCRHDDDTIHMQYGDQFGMTSSDYSLLDKARPRGLGKNEMPAKGKDGIVRIVERG